MVNPSKSHLSVWIMTTGCKQIQSESVSEPSSIILHSSIPRHTLLLYTHMHTNTHAVGQRALTYVCFQVYWRVRELQSISLMRIELWRLWKSCSTSLKCWKLFTCQCQPGTHLHTPTAPVKYQCKYEVQTHTNTHYNEYTQGSHDANMVYAK